LKEAMVSYLKALPTYSHVTLMTLQRISDWPFETEARLNNI
jgi:hypothetical protein